MKRGYNVYHGIISSFILHSSSFIMLILFLALFALPAAANVGAGIDESFFAEGGPLDRPVEAGLEASSAEAIVPGAAPAAGPEIDLAASGIKVIGGLAFVTALIVGLYKFGQKAKLPFFSGGDHVKRIATEAIGPNQFISIVEIAGKVLVLGVSEKGLSTLAELNGEAADRIRLADSTERTAAGVDRAPFRKVFSSLTGWMKDGTIPASGTARFDEICAHALLEERRRMEGMRI